MKTHIPSYRLISLTLVLFTLALSLSACNPLGDKEAEASADDLVAQIPLPDDGAAQAEDTFVGLTENGIGVGLVVNDGAAVAYICDGRELGHWLKGNLDDETLDLQHAAGTRLEAELVDSAITGTVTLSDGEQQTFSAAPAVNEGSGLFRTTELQDGFVYGWIVLVDDEGLATVRGVGVDSKTKAVDGSVSADVMDPGMDFGVPGEDGVMDPDIDFGAPSEAAETTGGTGNPVIDADLPCDQIKANYDAHIFAANHATNKAVRSAYLQAAWDYMQAGGLKGCPV